MASLSHPVILKHTVKCNNIPIRNHRVIPDGCSSSSVLSSSYPQQTRVSVLNCRNKNFHKSRISLYSVFLPRTQNYRHTHSPVSEVVTFHNFILKKLIVDLLVKNFLTFYRVGRFITGFISSNDIWT